MDAAVVEVVVRGIDVEVDGAGDRFVATPLLHPAMTMIRVAATRRIVDVFIGSTIVQT